MDLDSEAGGRRRDRRAYDLRCSTCESQTTLLCVSFPGIPTAVCVVLLVRFLFFDVLVQILGVVVCRSVLGRISRTEAEIRGFILYSNGGTLEQGQ